MWEDFKAFIMRGNVIDMAVGIIIGGAFGKIVSSFVNDIVMPPIGVLLAGVDFKGLYMNLSKTHYASLADAEAAGAPVIKYGLFINNCIDFLIIAAVIFLVLRALMKLKKPEVVEETEKECPFCKTKIAISATRCPHCTSQLNEPADATKPLTEVR
ncbi:MAG: large-conductance mechanosensitive channel protein MscL [Negativicoccus succinicivorans]|nr:large-conductance mechanosensitive channel protein MscL [Negativicoccus succinicivorans]